MTPLIAVAAFLALSWIAASYCEYRAHRAARVEERRNGL